MKDATEEALYHAEQNHRLDNQLWVPTVHPTIDLFHRFYPLKTKDVSGNFASSTSIAVINGLGDGSSESQRIGRTVAIHNVDVRFTGTVNSAINAGYLRTLVFSDHQANGLTPATNEVIAGTYKWLAPYNRDNRGRFTIYSDNCDIFGLTTTDNQVLLRRVCFNISPPLITQYTGTGSTAASINTNSLWVLFFMSSVSQYPTVSYETRIYYTDC